MSALIANPTIIAPSAAGDLILDLSADSLSGADGSAVSSWADLTGTYTAVQATGTKQPLLRTTGGPAGGKTVEFDGSDDCLTIASFAMSSWATVLCVCKKMTAATTPTGYIMEHSASIGSNPGFVISATGNPAIQMKRAAGSLATNAFIAWTGFGEWNIVGAACGPTALALLGGNVVGAAPFGQVPYARSSLTDTLNIGSANNGASAATNHSFARILIFNRFLGPTKLAGVTNYLRQTYNLPH